MGGLLLGMQSSPQLPFSQLFSSLADRQSLADSVDKCQQAASYAVAYQPEGQSAYGERQALFHVAGMFHRGLGA